MTAESMELCKILGALNFNGQHTIVTPESFSKPNFRLVVQLLTWFARILGDDSDLKQVKVLPLFSLSSKQAISELQETEISRFFVEMGRYFYKHLGVHLNLIKLYKSNEESCGELLKIAELIYETALELLSNDSNLKRTLDAEGTNDSTSVDLTTKHKRNLLNLIQGEGNLNQLTKSTNELAGKMNTLIAQEDDLNDQRQLIIDRQFELEHLKKSLMEACEQMKSKIINYKEANESLERDSMRLDELLKVKELELEEVRGKLNDLQLQSPAYMDQHDKLHKQYEFAYETYVSQYRSLMYLKSCVEIDSDLNAAVKGSNNSWSRVEAQVDVTPDALFEAALVDDELEVAGGDMSGPLRLRRAPAAGIDSTTGPARLLESLLLAEGASNPISESSTGGAAVVEGATWTRDRVGPRGLDAVGAAAATDAVEGDDCGPKAALPAGRYSGRETAAGDAGTLELEGLLKEFVADSALDTGKLDDVCDVDDDDEDDEDTDESGSNEGDPEFEDDDEDPTGDPTGGRAR